ncbi:MAG: NADAR family protein, partial [Bacteroidota bacterium]
LISEIEKGKSYKYMAFWGHKPSWDGSLTKTCFSQWWAGNAFKEGAIIYPTAEHYMMAGKAKLFDDQEMFSKIIQSHSPGEAKKLGRQVRNFDPSTWESKRCEIVVRGNYLKFSQHKPLQEFLLNTNNRIIVEASPVDKIWGIGMDPNHPHVENPRNWLGENLLGFCLMETRELLKT